MLIKFLTTQDFSKTALTALLSTIGVGVLTVGLTYVTKLSQANGSDIKPTMSLAMAVPIVRPPNTVTQPMTDPVPSNTDTAPMPTLEQSAPRPSQQPPAGSNPF